MVVVVVVGVVVVVVVVMVVFEASHFHIDETFDLTTPKSVSSL